MLATAAVHHHLIRKGLRTSVGLVVETGEPREVHHFACLAGFGAEAINPYLAFDTLLDMHARGEFPKEVDAYEVVKRYIKSVGKACSRSCPRWAFRPTNLIAGRRFLTPSG